MPREAAIPMAIYQSMALLSNALSNKTTDQETTQNMKIAVAGTGYVGLSIATLLAQHNEVVAVDVIPEKVEKINNRISPIQDEYIEISGRERTQPHSHT